MKTELEKYTKEELIALIKDRENDAFSLDKENHFLKGEIAYLKYKMGHLLYHKNPLLALRV